MGTYGKGGAMGAHLSPVTSLPSFLLGMKDRAPASTEWSIWSDSYIRLTMILAAPPSEDSTLTAMKLAEMAEQAFKFMEHQRSESTQPNYQPRWLTLYSEFPTSSLGGVAREVGNHPSSLASSLASYVSSSAPLP